MATVYEDQDYYVYRLLVSRDLDVYATYFDLAAGSARSLPIVAG